MNNIVEGSYAEINAKLPTDFWLPGIEYTEFDSTGIFPKRLISSNVISGMDRAINLALRKMYASLGSLERRYVTEGIELRNPFTETFPTLRLNHEYLESSKSKDLIDKLRLKIKLKDVPCANEQLEKLDDLNICLAEIDECRIPFKHMKKIITNNGDWVDYGVTVYHPDNKFEKLQESQLVEMRKYLGVEDFNSFLIKSMSPDKDVRLESVEIVDSIERLLFDENEAHLRNEFLDRTKSLAYYFR